MIIKDYFFGKECKIDKNLDDYSDLERHLQEKSVNFDHILLLNQIHSNRVMIVDDESKIYNELPKADAIITNLPNVAIAVITADCAPVLLYDEEENIIAAVHAGWKGAKSDIIRSAIMAMRDLGAQNIRAKIGPTIQQPSYQVCQEFYDEFLADNIGNKAFFTNCTEPKKYKFNLPFYVEEKIRAQRVKRVDNLGVDTYKNEDRFHSYRRSTHQKMAQEKQGKNVELDCGRNISLIVLN